MMWPFKRHHDEVVGYTAPPDEEAASARDRALAANRRAEEVSQEMHDVAGRIRGERTKNHFAPLVLDAMKGRK